MDFAHRAESDRASRGYPAKAGREAPLLRRAVKFEYIRHPRILGPCRYIFDAKTIFEECLLELFIFTRLLSGIVLLDDHRTGEYPKCIALRAFLRRFYLGLLER